MGTLASPRGYGETPAFGGQCLHGGMGKRPPLAGSVSTTYEAATYSPHKYPSPAHDPPQDPL
jgi:hypothetical protein